MKYILFQLRLKNLIKQNLIKTENGLKDIKKFQKNLIEFSKNSISESRSEFLTGTGIPANRPILTGTGILPGSRSILADGRYQLMVRLVSTIWAGLNARIVLMLGLVALRKANDADVI